VALKKVAVKAKLAMAIKVIQQLVRVVLATGAAKAVAAGVNVAVLRVLVVQVMHKAV
jgi:hypothetical protein